MSDLEVKNNGIKLNTQPTDGSTPQVKSQNAGTTKPTIFKGMTEAQAKELGVIDEFNRANTTKDGVISEEEFTNYSQNINENANTTQKSQSGKRVAQNGVYTVKSGDTLSKIAKDFGLNLYVLYNLNKDTIGSDMNVIQVGQKIKITKSASGDSSAQIDDNGNIQLDEKTQKVLLEKLSKIKLSDATMDKLAKMFNDDSIKNLSTVELVQRAKTHEVGELVQAFQMIIDNEDKKNLSVIKATLSDNGIESSILGEAVSSFTDKENSTKFFADLTKLLGKDVTHMKVPDLLKEIKSLPDDKKAELNKLFSNQIIDYELDNIVEDNTDIKVLLSKIGVGENASDEEIAKAITDRVTSDLDVNNEKSLLKAQLDKINNDGLTSKEKKLYGDVSSLSNEQKLAIARSRVCNMYLKSFTNANYTSLGKHDYKSIYKFTMSYLKSDFDKIAGENGAHREVYAASITVSMDDTGAPAEFKEKMGNVVAQNSNKLGVDALSDEMFVQTTNQVAQYADGDSLNKYSNDNSKRADIIKSVYQDVLSNTTDEGRKSVLNGAIKTTEQIIQNGPSGRSGSADGDGAVSNTSNRSAVTNPIYDNKGNDVAETAQLSHAFMKSHITKTPYQQRKEQMQQVQAQLEQAAEEMHKKMGVAIAGLKNKPPEKALSIVFSHYDQMPDKAKTYFINYLTRQFNEHPDALCEIYLKGDTTVRQFLQDQHIMTINDVYAHLDEHPEDLKYASKTIKTNYYAYSSKKMMQDMMSNPQEQKKKLQNESNWHVLDFSRTQLT